MRCLRCTMHTSQLILKPSLHGLKLLLAQTLPCQDVKSNCKSVQTPGGSTFPGGCCLFDTCSCTTIDLKETFKFLVTMMHTAMLNIYVNKLKWQRLPAGRWLELLRATSSSSTLTAGMSTAASIFWEASSSTLHSRVCTGLVSPSLSSQQCAQFSHLGQMHGHALSSKCQRKT